MEENKTTEIQNNSQITQETNDKPESDKPFGGYQYEFKPGQQKKRHYVFPLGKFFLGLVLIVVGLLFLARAFGWLHFDFNFNISQLWPLLLIILGLSMLATKSWLVNIFSLVILIVVVAIVLFLIFSGALYKDAACQNVQNIFLSHLPQIGSV